MNKTRQILVIRLGAIGDTVTFLPVVGALRNNFPKAYIELMGYPERLVIGTGPRYANVCTAFDVPGMSSFLVKNSVLPQQLSNYFKKFDLVLAFLNDEEKIFSENLKRAGAKEILVIPPFPVKNSSKHITDYLLECLVPLGIHSKNNLPEIFLNEEEENFGRNFLEEYNLSNCRTIAVHPGSGSLKKCWAKENFVELSNMIIDEGYKLFLISGPADKDIVKFIKNQLNEKSYFLIEDFPYSGLPQFLNYAVSI